MMNTAPQVSTRVNDPASVEAAILSRFSARAYLPKPVDRAVLQEVLSIAARAPSGTNTQPWKVYVLQGAKRDELVAKTCAAHDAISANPALAADYAESYDYYPEKWVIGKGDKALMHAQHQKNFRFFDAPVGLMFTIDKVMGRGSLLDYGMFLQSLMVAARSRGLHTCPQAAWNGFSKVILPLVGAGDNEMLVCGMSLGYADETALVNTFQTTRVSGQDFTHWVD
jgi:nitroreductase